MIDIAFRKDGGILRLNGEYPDGTKLRFSSGHDPLFRLRLLRNGEFTIVTSSEAGNCTKSKSRDIIILRFADFKTAPGLSVTCSVRHTDDDSLEWGLELSNDSDYTIDLAEYPCISIPSLPDPEKSDGFRVFIPKTEGIETYRLAKIDPVAALKQYSYQSIYPGVASMQYLAWYNNEKGFYFAAHDISGMPKNIRAYRDENNTYLSMASFPGVLPHTTLSLPYPTVTALTGGGWESSAELYRHFIETSGFPLPKKLAVDDSLPEWYRSQPIVVIYPPRSVRGTGYYGPNEFYPYERGMKYINELSDELGGVKIFVFLTYWEGSAPWAPPFNWPPFGDVESFRNYVKMLHNAGHYIGLYGSGLNWTDKSLLVDYDMTEYRESHNIADTFCVKPDGEYYPGACGSIRTGHHMCPGVKVTRDIATEQTEKIFAEGVDFFQLFDQDLGGFGCPCYSPYHGHPPVFGAWLTGTTSKLYAKLSEMGGGKAFIGTEDTCADWHMRYLRFNDNRRGFFDMNARAVPAFQYVNHEYVNNFLGNLCGFKANIGLEGNDDWFIYSMAYATANGDLMSFPIKSGGEIHWEWGMDWLTPGPNRADAVACISNYQAFRTGVAEKYLFGGRMERAYPIAVSGEPYIIHCVKNPDLDQTHSYVQTARWRSADGYEAQVLVSFSRTERTVKLNAHAKRILTADGKLPFTVEDGITTVKLPPFTAALAEL
ncbi:MAG: hypothetical protein GX628_02400 [Clostridiales bacterium]|nr:hypothetical protein [Clostridiales bacterium]